MYNGVMNGYGIGNGEAHTVECHWCYAIWVEWDGVIAACPICGEEAHTAHMDLESHPIVIGLVDRYILVVFDEKEAKGKNSKKD